MIFNLKASGNDDNLKSDLDSEFEEYEECDKLLEKLIDLLKQKDD